MTTSEDRIDAYRAALESRHQAEQEADAVKAAFFGAGTGPRPSFAALVERLDNLTISIGALAATWRDLTEEERDQIGPPQWRERSRCAGDLSQPSA